MRRPRGRRARPALLPSPPSVALHDGTRLRPHAAARHAASSDERRDEDPRRRRGRDRRAEGDARRPARLGRPRDWPTRSAQARRGRVPPASSSTARPALLEQLRPHAADHRRRRCASASSSCRPGTPARRRTCARRPRPRAGRARDARPKPRRRQRAAPRPSARGRRRRARDAAVQTSCEHSPQTCGAGAADAPAAAALDSADPSVCERRPSSRKERRRGRHQHQPGRPHRQPDADPELRSLPSGTSVCRLRIAVQHAPQGRRDRRVGGQAATTST